MPTGQVCLSQPADITADGPQQYLERQLAQSHLLFAQGVRILHACKLDKQVQG